MYIIHDDNVQNVLFNHISYSDNISYLSFTIKPA